MVFYYFGPDPNSWAFGNDHFSYAHNLTGSIEAIWNDLGKDLPDKQQAGTQIQWMSTAGDKFAIMTKIGNLLCNCDEVVSHVTQQLRAIPGTFVEHISLSPQGGWFIRYNDSSCQIGGRWPDSFYPLVAYLIDTRWEDRQVSTIQSIFVGHGQSIVIKTTSAIIRANVTLQLEMLFNTLTAGWMFPGPGTVFCPWSPQYYFIQAVSSVMRETQYPYSLPVDKGFGDQVYMCLINNVRLPASLKLSLPATSTPVPAPTTSAPTNDAPDNGAPDNGAAASAPTYHGPRAEGPFAVPYHYASPPVPTQVPFTPPYAPLPGRGFDSEVDKLGKKLMDSSLRDSISSAILSEKPNVSWEDVAGLEAAKTELQESIIFPIRFPQMFRGKRQARRGLLLYGPPGTGKSYLAKAVATEVDHTLFSVSSGDIMSKWSGESEGLMRQLFVLAREKKPSIIFIDEIDALCGKRDSGSANAEDMVRLKTEFMVQMDGLGNNNDGVFLLAATNLPWALDPAVRRRFQKRIHVPLPDFEARQELFKVHLGDMASSLENTEVEFATLAKRTEGFSGSDIANLVQDALMMPIRKVHTATHFRKFRDNSGEWYTPCGPRDAGAEAMRWSKVPAKQLKEPSLTIEDLYKAVENTKPSVGKEEIEKCAEWTTLYGVEGV